MPHLPLIAKCIRGILLSCNNAVECQFKYIKPCSKPWFFFSPKTNNRQTAVISKISPHIFTDLDLDNYNVFLGKRDNDLSENMSNRDGGSLTWFLRGDPFFWFSACLLLILVTNNQPNTFLGVSTNWILDDTRGFT